MGNKTRTDWATKLKVIRSLDIRGILNEKITSLSFDYNQIIGNETGCFRECSISPPELRSPTKIQSEIHFEGEPILSPMVRRKLTRQPGGVLMTLFLVLLLAFGSRPCMMLGQADLAPPSSHDCCPDLLAISDLPDDPPPSPCHDSPCPQAIDSHDWASPHGPTVSGSDHLSQPLVIAWQLPPDWSGGGQHSPFLAAKTTGPPSAQRSRVLRL